MNILFGYRLNTNMISVISKRLEARGVANTWEKRDSKRGIMECLRDGVKSGRVDIVVVMESMLSGNYSADELAYMAYHDNVKVIPILSSTRRGTDYMRTLLYNGIYCAVYVPDVKNEMSIIENLILHGRNYQLAQEYYGL